MVSRVLQAKRFFLFSALALLALAGQASAQTATQTVTIRVAERHALSVEAPGSNQTYRLETSRESKKITGTLTGDSGVVLSLAPPERGYGTGSQLLGPRARDLVVGYFPADAPPLRLQYLLVSGTEQPVVKLTLTD
jgi:opacity protein-like surface antigen